MEKEKKEEVSKSLPHYSRVKDMCIDLYTQTEQTDKRLLRGRVLLNRQKGEMAFVENEPRGARSVEVGRTQHSRYVRRPDGYYTVTFRIRPDEKNIREQLLSEVRTVVKDIDLDYKALKGGLK